jgi:hypothetical protein
MLEGQTGQQEAVAKLLKVLEEDPLPLPTPKAVRQLAQDLFPGTDVEGVAKKALREARTWVMEAFKALREDLGIPTDPSDREVRCLDLGIRDSLRRGLRVEAMFDRPDEVVFYVYGKGGRPVGPVGHLCGSEHRFRLRGGSPSTHFWLAAKAGWVKAEGASGLAVGRGRAFLYAISPWWVEVALAEARSFPSFLAALGLSDLEGALVALSELEDGKVRREGPYLLVRERSAWFLRRGAVFESPDLDAALLTGRRVALSYPRGLEVSLKGFLRSEQYVHLEEFALRFEGEEVCYKGTGPFWGSAAGDLRYRLACLMRGSLRKELEKASPSPKMRALIEELARSEDPLEAPKDEAFFRKVELRLLAKL